MCIYACLCMCCIPMCVTLHVCVYMQVEDQSWCRNHSLLIFHLIHWGRVSQSNLEHANITGLDCHLAMGTPLSLPSEAGIIGWLPGPPGIYMSFWGSELQPSCLYSKCLMTEPFPQLLPFVVHLKPLPFVHSQSYNYLQAGGASLSHTEKPMLVYS